MLLLPFFHSAYPQLHIIHHMDDILLAGPIQHEVHQALANLQSHLDKYKLILAPEKVQQQFPYQYLGHQLLHTGACPPKVQLTLDQLKSLSDFQRVWGF